MGKENLYTIKYFAKLHVGKMQVYQAIARVESGMSHLHGVEAGQPLKVSKIQEKQVVKAMENKSGSSQPMRDPMPLSTDVLVMNVLIQHFFVVD